MSDPRQIVYSIDALRVELKLMERRLTARLEGRKVKESPKSKQRRK